MSRLVGQGRRPAHPGGDLGRLSRGRDGFQDTPVARQEDFVAYINGLNELWVRAGPRLSPRVLCDLLRFTGEATSTYFQSLDPLAIGVPVSWAGPDPAPVWLDIARDYTERWVHQQQIRDALGKPPITHRRLFAPGLETFARALPATLRGVGAPDGAVVALDISGESGGAWSVARAAGDWVLYRGRPSAPDALVTIDQETAWRLFTRGITRDRARGAVKIQGDDRLGAKVLETVSIIA